MYCFKLVDRNKDIINHYWLYFSQTTGKLYFYIYKLVEIKKGNLSSDRFCDWKHVVEKLSYRETSKRHLEAINTLNRREKIMITTATKSDGRLTNNCIML